LNFLAHGLLGGEQPEVVTGSFLGDFYRGTLDESLSGDLRFGIQLHRHIDAVSNRLPGIRLSVARYPRSVRRFAPIFLDVLADHFLARHFVQYWDGDLHQFTSRLYQQLQSTRSEMPPEASRFVDHAFATNLLHRYANLPEIAQVYRSIERRFTRPMPGLAESAFELSERLYSDLESDFHAYFPVLQNAAREFSATKTC